MANCDQQPQSEGVPPLSGSVSPVGRDTYPPLSHGQDESQAWLAYDRAANCSPASAPPEPVDCLAGETRSMVIEDTLPRHRGPSLNKFQTIMQMKERTRAKADTKTESHLSPESPMWRSTSLLFGLVVFGFMLALGHHSVFNFLDGKQVSSDSQNWVNRILNGDALIVKTCWTLAVGLAFQHTLWYSFRRHHIKIQSMDKLLNLRSDVLGFLFFDFFRCVPVAMALATITWLSPALPVVVPGTLSVEVNQDGVKQSLPCTIPTFGQGGQQSELGNIVMDVLLANGIAPFTSPCGLYLSACFLRAWN